MHRLRIRQPDSFLLCQCFHNIVWQHLQNHFPLSVLVIAELDYGAKASQKAKKNLKKLYGFVDIVQVVPFDFKCAKIFGTTKSKLRKLGKPTGERNRCITQHFFVRQGNPPLL